VDLSEDGILPQMNEQQFMGAIADVINDYALGHPNTVSKEDLQMFLSQISGQDIQIPGKEQPVQPTTPEQIQAQQPQQSQQPQGLLQAGRA